MGNKIKQRIPTLLSYFLWFLGLLSKSLKSRVKELSCTIPTSHSIMKRSRRPDPTTVKKLKEDMDKYILTQLECTVCNKVPSNTLDNDCCAEGGHFICRQCMADWKEECESSRRDVDCPSCQRRWRPVKNVFRQVYLERYHKCNKVACSHDDCSTEDWIENLVDGNHEDYCIHRLCKAPARESTNFCDWTGSVEKVGKHIQEHKCANFCLPQNPAEDGNVIKFSQDVPNNRNYFLHDFPHSLKPNLLVHPRLMRGLFWVQLERTRDGWWLLYVLASLKPKALKKSRAKIRVFAQTNKRFGGNVRVLSSDMDRSSARASGSFLTFHDAQIRKYYSQESLFKMDVEIHSPQTLRDELNDANLDEEVDYGQQLCDDILESPVAASQDDGPTISVPDGEAATATFQTSEGRSLSELLVEIETLVDGSEAMEADFQAHRRATRTISFRPISPAPPPSTSYSPTSPPYDPVSEGPGSPNHPNHPNREDRMLNTPSPPPGYPDDDDDVEIIEFSGPNEEASNH